LSAIVTAMKIQKAERSVKGTKKRISGKRISSSKFSSINGRIMIQIVKYAKVPRIVKCNKWALLIQKSHSELLFFRKNRGFWMTISLASALRMTEGPCGAELSISKKKKSVKKQKN
jgi:hypothetical protein